MTDAIIHDTEDLGRRIHDRRRDLGLTQIDLAGVARVTPRLIGELERGKPTARVDGVLRVLAALGLDLYLRSR
jgi:HTH-type transcriptional regulator/antitoxin HipB